LTGRIGDMIDMGGSSNAPVVIDRDGGRVYRQQTFVRELELARHLVRYAALPAQSVPSVVDRGIEAIARAEYAAYTGSQGAPTQQFRNDRQLQDDAVRSAVVRALSIICGGPGTGKTTTVVRILECLMLLRGGLRIVLAAPTGKAATRMMNSVHDALKRAPAAYPNMMRARREGRVSESTIHRLLLAPGGSGYKPDKRHPLEADVLVIDEASMMDMDLAARLFDVLDPARTRVIILGDRHQLAAVGPGSVLADLTGETGALSPLVTRLVKSRRFDENSRVGRLAAAINAGVPEGVVAEFDNGHPTDAGSVRLVASDSRQEVARAARKWVTDSLAGYAARLQEVARQGLYKDQNQFQAVCAGLWQLFNGSRALAAQREGLGGVDDLNDAAEAMIRGIIAGLDVPPAERRLLDCGEFYLGRAVIVRKNARDLDVYNGDVGIMLPDASGRYCVYFGDTGKTLSAALLPVHQTAFVITIHQSQGSEYDHVAVVMPSAVDSGLATRELLYTGVTRARDSAEVFCSMNVLRHAVETATERIGGLSERLAGEMAKAAP
jgi:exodeoxyribonuclease V alpha subunit